MKEYVIGIDIGTTNVKSVLFQTNGTVEKVEEQKIKTNYPHNQYAEQDPQEVEAAARSTLRNIIQQYNQNDIKGIGLCTAMHSLVLTNDGGEALTNVMIWSDARATEDIKDLTAEEQELIYTKTGTPLHAMTPFAKLLWMDKEGMQEKTHAFIFSLKEYLLYHWFNERVIDYSMANATGLFNIHNLDWDKEILSKTGVCLQQMSTVVQPTYRLKNWDARIKKEIGIQEEIPFIIGAADGQLANLGSGAIETGEVAITMGTSGAIRQLAHGFPINKKQQTFTYAFTENTSIIGGPTNNGGIVIQWLKDLFEDEQDFTDFINYADQSSVGANGLLFLPYINGERSPLWDTEATGEFKGVKINHKKSDFIRAVLEGITYNLLYISMSLEKIGNPFEKINVNGGMAQSALWSQMLADMLGRPIYVSETHHNAAWGASFVALLRVGKATDFHDIKHTLPKEIVYYPNMNNNKYYQETFNSFKKHIDRMNKGEL